MILGLAMQLKRYATGSAAILTLATAAAKEERDE